MSIVYITKVHRQRQFNGLSPSGRFSWRQFGLAVSSDIPKLTCRQERILDVSHGKLASWQAFIPASRLAGLPVIFLRNHKFLWG